MAEHSPDLSRSAAARLIRGHLVLLNGKPGDPADKVAEGDVIDVEVPEAFAADPAAEPIPLEIVYEDEDIATTRAPRG